MFGKHVHVHVHVDNTEPDWARRMRHQLEKIKENTDTIMASQEQFNEVLSRIDTATTDIAEDLRKLREEIAAGMTTEQEASVLARLDAAATSLEAVAADPENPVPDPEPEPDPEPTPEPDPSEPPAGRNR